MLLCCSSSMHSCSATASVVQRSEAGPGCRREARSVRRDVRAVVHPISRALQGIQLHLAVAYVCGCADVQTVVPSAAAVPEVYKEGADPEIQAYQEHQKTAAQPTSAEDARTLLKLAK